jgi:Fe-S cluster biogenesis protein NfuA
VTFSDEFDPSQLETAIESVIMTRMLIHDPAFSLDAKKPKTRQSVSPEIDKIEEILYRTVRPGLQSDGGDIEVLDYTDHRLLVNYQGACGTCPSSAMGTLEAIRSILSYEFDPEIDVIIAPQPSSEPSFGSMGGGDHHVEQRSSL